MNAPTVGALVKVRIREPERYANGCATALDGKLGVIERQKADGEFLVEFYTPAPAWWANQTPTSAFWFPAADLEVLP